MDTLICLSTEEVLCSPQLNSSAEQKCTNSALEELQNRTSPQCTGRVTWQAWRLPSAARVRMSSSGLHLILDSQQSTVNSIISGKYNYILLFWLWVFKSWLKRFCNIKRCFSLNHMFYIVSITIQWKIKTVEIHFNTMIHWNMILFGVCTCECFSVSTKSGCI